MYRLEGGRTGTGNRQGKKSGKILSKSYSRHLAETLRCQKEGPMLQHTGPRLMRNKAAKTLARYDQRGKL